MLKQKGGYWLHGQWSHRSQNNDHKGFGAEQEHFVYIGNTCVMYWYTICIYMRSNIFQTLHALLLCWLLSVINWPTLDGSPIWSIILACFVLYTSCTCYSIISHKAMAYSPICSIWCRYFFDSLMYMHVFKNRKLHGDFVKLLIWYVHIN